MKHSDLSAASQSDLLAATQNKVFRPCHPTNPVPQSPNYVQPMITGGVIRRSERTALKPPDPSAATQNNFHASNGGFIRQSERTALKPPELDSNNRQAIGFNNLCAADLYLREVKKQWESGKRASLKPGKNSGSLVDSDDDDEVQDSRSVLERTKREEIRLKRRRRHKDGSSHDQGLSSISGNIKDDFMALDPSHSGNFAYQVSPFNQRKSASSASTFSVVSQTSRQLTGSSFTVFDRCHSHALSEISAASVKGQFDDADDST